MRLRLAAVLFVLPAAFGQNLAGIWDATVRSATSTNKQGANGYEVPFRFEIAGDGSSIRGTFFNGEERYTSNRGTFSNGKLTLYYDYYAARLEATLKDGRLEGTYFRARNQFDFAAAPHKDAAAVPGAPSINGAWEIALQSSKGEAAWQFLVTQKGGDVDAAILRIDGDTGKLSGSWRGDKFFLSHFDGARAAIMEIVPQQDGSLQVRQNGTAYTALRPEVARSRGLAPPTDPTEHTGVNDPSEPLRFHFKDINGKMVSQDDPRFKGKVVAVNMMGSWCPNCHDEAPFLVELYKKFHSQGLEVVQLAFEDEDQINDLSRLKAFVKNYGIEYTVLVPGIPAEANEKMPQLKNFNAWPTTFLLGRDGRVAHVHAGFPSSASGDKYEEAKLDLTSAVERLLAPGASSTNGQ